MKLKPGLWSILSI